MNLTESIPLDSKLFHWNSFESQESSMDTLDTMSCIVYIKESTMYCIAQYTMYTSSSQIVERMEIAERLLPKAFWQKVATRDGWH